MMRSANPTLSDRTFKDLPRVWDQDQAMTVEGTTYKSAILLFCILLTAGFTWFQFFQTGNSAAVSGWMMLGIFGGLITGFVTIFKKEWAAITAPIYALMQGLFIGGLSAILEASYPGIVIQAAALTFGTMAAMLVAYSTGLIRATEKFKLGVIAATGGIAIVYFSSIILGFFGVNLSFIHGSGMMGIGFRLFVCVIAALNLIIDFDFIEKGARAGAPKYMEWYGAFALMVTLVWLYIEILRLLAKMRTRR